MESFRPSISTDHAECEGVILHTQCGQLLHTLSDQSVTLSVDLLQLGRINKNSSGDEIANVNFFYNIAHVEASAYAH